MLEIHYLHVVVTAVSAFVMSSIWYTVFGKARMALLDQDPRATADMRKVPAWKKATELVRELVIAYVVARFVVQLGVARSEEHTSELQSPCNLVCRLLLEKK